jgi:hypothetical protein
MLSYVGAGRWVPALRFMFTRRGQLMILPA